jgi:putative endonuclease
VVFENIWKLFRRNHTTPVVTERGREGERLATEYLAEHGFDVTERNWKCSFGELDIIARYGELLIIVEVKSAGRDSVYRPEYRVNKRKQDKIKRLTRAYLKSQRADLPVRYDVVTVVWCSTGAKIDHFENAFA